MNVTGDLAVSGKVTALSDVAFQGASLHTHIHKLAKTGADHVRPPK